MTDYKQAFLEVFEMLKIEKAKSNKLFIKLKTEKDKTKLLKDVIDYCRSYFPDKLFLDDATLISVHIL